jgi:lipid A 3-O-deacylase
MPAEMRQLLWVLFGFILFARPEAAVSAEGSEDLHPYGRGKQHVGLSLGYGEGFEFFSSRNNENSEVEHTLVMPNWSIGLTDGLASGRWYEGSLDLVGEAQYFSNDEPRSGYYAAGAISLRYNFLAMKRVVPFFSMGTGIGYLDYDLDDQRDGLNFVLQGGVGLAVPINRKWGVTAESRFHHISNANTRDPNDGINSGVFILGTTFYFD